MTKKSLILAALLVAVLATASLAAPVPPAKGQWAWILEDTIRLYDEADIESGYTEIDAPGKWISVPSAVRDDDNYLWYKVKIGKDSGWLPQNGVRLKMGPKSKSAANLYKAYLKNRRRTEYSEDDTFTIDDAKICRQLLGVNLINLPQPELRKKLGTPTFRESPYDDKDLNILSFELSDRNMTLSVTEKRSGMDRDGKVIAIEVYEGRAGEQVY
ncbi:MAG: hypothetical protein IJT02_08830 [Synergistaceae bacterium]|nr:hypothetical protein [Synergistaceae bacterium]